MSVVLRFWSKIFFHNTNNIFPIILKVAKREQKILKIFGNDWETYDGTGVRDYIHVMDLAEGHTLALDKILNSEPQNIQINFQITSQPSSQ